MFRAISRIGRLLMWLLGACWQFRHLDNALPETRQKLLRDTAAKGLAILNMNVDRAAQSTPPNGVLVVANHVSWLDILAIMAHFPVGFIAAKELKNWFIVGKMIENAGTVFIDRNNRKDIEPINATIAAHLQAGKNVCFFPEARTSLGNGVLPLKAALFQAALNADAPVQALALRYYDEQNQRTTQITFSDTNFFVSLWRIARLPEIRLQINESELFEPHKLPECDRFVLKDLAQNYLREVVLSDSPNPNLLIKEKS